MPTLEINKRPRTEDRKTAPCLYQPFRAVGYVCNEIPFLVQSRGQDYFLTTCVGKSFHIYNCSKMNLLFVGPQTENPITAMACQGDLTFAASGSDIIIYKRTKEISRIKTDVTGSIVSLLMFGQHVIAVTDDNSLKMYDHATKELYTELELENEFTVTSIVHPSTYLNKVLIGSKEGTMQLWNIRTGKLVHSFKSFGSPITSLTQSPVVDVVAVGLLDGTVVIHNIRVDETIMKIKQEGKVTGVSFRTDDQHIMASANAYGDISLWDLDKRRLVHVMKGAHDGLIASVQFLNGQPILLSSGADNSVKQWIFDSLDGLPRLLKSRSGHHAPPTFIRYYGPDGHLILSAGRDRSLRLFSTIRDAQSTELSQGHLSRKSRLLNLKIDDLKLPQILHFSASDTRQKDWDNVLTTHLNDTAARTWSIQRKALGKHVLKTSDGSALKVTAISACGNFGFVGAASGRVDMFNLQSGLHRRTFSGHTKAITGIVADSINRYVVTSSLDGTVKVWSFQTADCVATLEIPAASIILNKENNLLAVAGDDLGIRIVDIETRRVVREFWGHRNRITDMAFFPDGRWLVSTSLDATIRTWDLPTGYLIDAFRVESVATSVSFSPAGDFLATSHVDHVGIFLWANRSQFANVPLRNLSSDEDPFSVEMPTSSGLAEGEEEELVGGVEVEGENAQLPAETIDQLSDEMITLSLLPRSKWQTLLNLEIIKKRNKPREPPKAPEKAPFFLPTLPGVDPKFVTETEKDTSKVESEKSRKVNFSELQVETEIAKRLKEGEQSGDFASFLAHLKTLNPSAVDFEIRSLSIDDNMKELRLFLRAITSLLSTHRDFELIETYLSVFLKVHGDLIARNYEEFASLVRELIDARKGSKRLDDMFAYTLCLLQFVRNA
ncbi:uncharacterized protein VTP21DRAFT_7850 [Calcarisporiella thermophila]|uniref:uncharacterized protein n=1 Tax=Calcarisporiella thermophila TaxID=911321 RepID=UPI00374210CE